MSDLINRQAAIDAADRADYTGLAIEDVKKVTDEVVKELKQLPSAQPEIIRCCDCKHYYCADNHVPQEKRYVCDLDFYRWNPDDYCSYAEGREDE